MPYMLAETDNEDKALSSGCSPVGTLSKNACRVLAASHDDQDQCRGNWLWYQEGRCSRRSSTFQENGECLVADLPKLAMICF
jgi:hypothetical protein